MQKCNLTLFRYSLHSSFIKSKALEDYSILFDDTLKNISRIDIKDFTKVIIENVKPLMQIAINMGFQGEWKYKQ